MGLFSLKACLKEDMILTKNQKLHEKAERSSLIQELDSIKIK